VLDELVTQAVELPGGALELRQPSESAELPDDGGVEWAPIAPYWSVLWRSGVALARELERRELRGMRLVELGCGLGVPAIVAARRGAAVLATDSDPEALELLALNAERNDARLETARVDWAAPDELLERAPFDLALAADVLYERQSVASLLALLPRLAPTALIADPGRPPAEAFLEGAAARAWRVATDIHGVVRIYRMELAARAAAG
jgi:predicted nicotinamide N-methyase